MTLNQLFQHYKELKSLTLSEQSYRTNIGYYENHVQSLLGEHDISHINFIDYQNFANNLLSKPAASGKPLSPKTVKNILVMLHTMYKIARISGWYIGDDIIKYVELPQFDNHRYFTISPEYQKRYILAILNFNEPVFKDIFLFLLHGRRLKEVLQLQWQFLDLVQGIMYLPARKNKSKKNLSFKLTDRQLNSLRFFHSLEIDRQSTVFPMGYVFKNPNTDLPYSDIRKAWRRLLDSYNLPLIRIHDIRHLVATYAINELSQPIEHVSHLLGHSDIQITQRYVNPKPENSKKVMDSLFDSLV